MSERSWTQGWIRDLAEAVQWAGSAVRAFWRNQILPVLTALSIFLVMAAPLMLVILVLWYLDSIGWRASPGFYTIGP